MAADLWESVAGGDGGESLRACVYQITNLVNGKYYIGVHRCGVQCARHVRCPYLGSGRALRAAIRKYGRENFRRDVLAETQTESFAYQLEAAVVNQAFVDRADNYNCKTGGLGGGSHRVGIEQTPEHRAKIGRSNAGRTPSAEARRKMREAKLGRPSGRKGTRLSEAHRLALRVPKRFGNGPSRTRFSKGHVPWNAKTKVNEHG